MIGDPLPMLPTSFLGRACVYGFFGGMVLAIVGFFIWMIVHLFVLLPSLMIAAGACLALGCVLAYAEDHWL